MQVHHFTQNCELESGHSLHVEGSLKNNLVFLRSIGAPDFILSIIENGYRLPFISFPLALYKGIILPILSLSGTSQSKKELLNK